MNGDPAEPKPDHNDELTLAYLSIDTMSAHIKNLEAENAALRKEVKNLAPEPEPQRDWRDDQYHRGIGGGPGY